MLPNKWKLWGWQKLAIYSYFNILILNKLLFLSEEFIQHVQTCFSNYLIAVILLQIGSDEAHV